MTSSPTLHRLLWGPTPKQEISAWRVRPWEVPAVGLPVQVGIALFCAATRHGGYPEGWGPSAGPLTWEICGGEDILSVGRQRQFGYAEAHLEADSLNSGLPTDLVRRSMAWEVDPHPAYLLPFTGTSPDDVHRGMFALYCDVLLLLTAIDGGETILNSLADTGASAVPFEDRWDWRSRVHLPKRAWRLIDRAFRWTEQAADELPLVREHFVEALQRWMPDKLTIQSFVAERVDLLLPDGSDNEIVRTVRSPGLPDPELPEVLQLDDAKFGPTLRVRIGQIDRWADFERIVQDFPAIDPRSAERIMEQVAAAFQSPGHGNDGNDPELVLLPEVAVPVPEVPTIRDLVRRTGRASLAGLFWRVLPPVYRGSGDATQRWFVNEAEFVLPVGNDDRGPTGVRWYRVRKPIPTHMETGLARTLGKQQGISWKILAGQRWYRFVHRRWGDFTIAICSDLLDAAPWRSLRGEILHLFMVAFNSDVGLFESLTWVRAYEDYVNLVSVNHGSKGGSFVWTPRTSHQRELAQLRGRRLFLLADVDIPVKRMIEAQREGVETAAERAVDRWLRSKRSPPDVKAPPPDFKAPPPGYERKADSMSPSAPPT